MDFIGMFNNFFETTGITIIKVFIIIILGVLLIKLLMRYIKRALMASSLEAGLSSFLLSVINAVLYIMLIFIVMSTLGVSMGAFIAALSAAGLAIALALQDSLSNLASGILILVNKPFVEGDYIKIGSEEGTVKTVKIFTTQIETYDKKLITIPNKSIVNGNVINYTTSPLRRVDLTFCVAFGTKQDDVKNVVKEKFKETKFGVKSPNLFIGVNKYTEHGLEFSFKIWGKAEDYWDLYYEAYEKLTDALQTANIVITNNQSIVKLSEEDIQARKEQLNQSKVFRKLKEEEKASKKKKHKEEKEDIEVIDENLVEIINQEETTAELPFVEQPKLQSPEINLQLEESPSQDLNEEKPKKKRKWFWGK